MLQCLNADGDQPELLDTGILQVHSEIEIRLCSGIIYVVLTPFGTCTFILLLAEVFYFFYRTSDVYMKSSENAASSVTETSVFFCCC
jgi:hypothetical protein